MGLPGGPELIIILVIVLVIFGAGKLPGVGRSLGMAITEFKEGIKGVKEETLDAPAKKEGEPKAE
ncbi:MAG: twin-arginine translocase TatA/TatE family subunit [Candidatus Hydrogenedentes bacterium]|nr:twin-arginine translocase TatA/TatE family subunit [Candidatus Hydrogenedentota bacterium]